MRVTDTTEARSSVQVTVVDEDGASLEGATVTFQPDGAAENPCEQLGAANEFTCGCEVEGEITIPANGAGRTPVEQVVTVDADECHVITELVTITLEAV